MKKYFLSKKYRYLHYIYRTDIINFYREIELNSQNHPSSTDLSYWKLKRNEITVKILPDIVDIRGVIVFSEVTTTTSMNDVIKNGRGAINGAGGATPFETFVFTW